MIVGPIDLKAIGGGAGLPAGNAVAGGASPAVSFASMLSDMATNTVGTLQHAEQVSVQGMQGQVDTREVVDAVMSAEQALQAAVAIRDKIVSAYMEISRMAI
jgi:flagellar hook-basal body complex protein FliE